MQIVETTNEGLKRGYTVTIPAKDIDDRIAAEVQKVAPQVRMPGFRPGKVPANLVRKMHGEALHNDALNASLRESVEGLIREKQLRPALQPRVQMAEGYEPGKDAELTVEVEVLPEIEAPSIDGLKLEKLNVPVTDEALEEALQRLASNQKNYDDAPEGRKAEDGDQIIIDFVGRVDGEEFAGANAEIPLVLGSGQFIPGFEEQLQGAVAGDEKTITVTFPENYPAENLKGKAAEFDIKVKQVKIEAETSIDDDFAKNLGLEGLDKLKELMKAQLQQETAGLTRTQMKRQLLDRLAADHDFPVPPTMVEAEFEQIWKQLEAEAAREEDPGAAQQEIEGEKEDYRRIAERRVRLGLLLSEIGQANGVEVTSQEMQMLVQQAAQQYRPDDRQRFVEYIRSEPMAQAQLRAPLYEDKVVDFLFDKAEVTEREVTRQELEAAIEAEETASSPAESAPAESKKKAPARKGSKKAAAEPASDEGGEAESSADDQASGEPIEAAEQPAVKKTAAKKSPAKTAEKKAATEKKPVAEKKPAAEKKTAAEKKPSAKKAPAKKAAKKAE